METPQLQLYNYIFQSLMDKGITTIDVKDLALELPYPFFVVQYLDNTKQKFTFDTYAGDISFMVHVWSLANDNAAHDEVVQYADEVLSYDVDLDGYSATLRSLNAKTMIDNTTNQTLTHTVLTAQYDVY